MVGGRVEMIRLMEMLMRLMRGRAIFLGEKSDRGLCHKKDLRGIQRGNGEGATRK